MSREFHMYRLEHRGFAAIIPCPRCRGEGWICEQECGRCSGTGELWFDALWLATLAHNLAIAAGLERAWLLGHSRGLFRPLKTDDDEIKAAYERDVWAPGRGRSTP